MARKSKKPKIIYKGILTMRLMNPEDGQIERRNRKYDVEIWQNPEANYGNQCGMSVTSRDDKGWQQLYDIRYDKDFHKDNPVPYIINWAFNYWTGKNGSWKIVSFTLAELIRSKRLPVKNTEIKAD